MKNLTSEVREKAIEIANALTDEGMKDSIAIPTAISRAKDWAANRDKKTRIKKGRETDPKIHGKDVYVIPHENEWGVKTEKDGKIKVFHYKDDAVKEARKKAKDANGSLTIQSKDGKIQERISYNPNLRKAKAANAK